MLSFTDAQAQALWAAEPDLINELVAIVQAEGPAAIAVPDNLRCLALRALSVQMSDRGRGSMIIASVSSRTRGGVLSMLLNKAVLSFVEHGKALVAESEGQPLASVSSSTTANNSSDFVEAILSLVLGMIGSSQVNYTKHISGDIKNS